MADCIQIYKVCTNCGGDGLFPNEEITFEGEILPPENPQPCATCGGTGMLEECCITSDFQTQIDDIQDTINDIKGKVNDIFELLNQ